MITEVKIKKEFIEQARHFAIEKRPTSYKRLGEKKEEEQLQHLFVGKLSEIIGQEGLNKENIPHFCPNKLKVVSERHYKDLADCIIFPKTEKKLIADFKTAWKPFHTRILVPSDQYFRQRKDIYIGVKLFCIDEEPFSAFPNFSEKAEIHGWIKRADLHKPSESSSRTFPAYWVYLRELHPLKQLQNYFLTEG